MTEPAPVEKRPLLIGVDGGASKTLALVADAEGEVLGRGRAGPSNYQVIGKKAAFRALEDAIRHARTGIPGEPAAICLGLAGAARPVDQEIFLAWAADRYPGLPVTLGHDGRLVLAAGAPEGWGIALLCGTGTLAYGEDQEGRSTRADGWGYLLGDAGSGYALGRAALRAVACADDGRGPETALTVAILTHWSLADPQGLVSRVYDPPIPRAEIAALARIVAEVAAEGDPVARGLLTDAGRDLATAVRAVALRLRLPQPIPCALAGSVILHAPIIAASMEAAARDFGLSLAPITRVHEPAQGAVRLARNLLTPLR